jgi:hypothetical protein
MFTKEDVGTVLYVDPRPWYLRMWHFVWFRVLRRKTPTYGTYVITEVVDSAVLTLSSSSDLEDNTHLTVASRPPKWV